MTEDDLFEMLPERSLIFSVFFFCFEFSFDIFFISSCVLVLLVFRNKIVQVRFCFSEFHLIHTFSSVPVKERLSAEHESELISDTLPCILDSSGVTNEYTGHWVLCWW